MQFTTSGHTLRAYLKGIGFPVHEQAPRVALAPSFKMNGRSISLPGMAPGSMAPSQQFIQIARESKNFANDAADRYIQWETLNAMPKEGQLSPFATPIGGSIAEYLISSYRGRYVTGYGMWGYMFWELRLKTSEDFTDSLVVYTLKAIQATPNPAEPSGVITPVNNPADNDYIVGRIRDALIVVDSGVLERAHLDAINDAIKDSKLIANELKQ
jgi:hypothetical protein